MQTCSHCRRDVDDNKQFCTYCGYRVKPTISSKLDKSKQQKQSKQPQKSMRTKVTFLIIMVIIIVIIGTLAAYFIEYRGQSEPDSDNDGIPDDEDDYPNDSNFCAKLDVINSNWYRLNESVYVILEFQNNKRFDIYWVESIVILKTASIEYFTSDYTVLYSRNILKPGDKAVSFWIFEDPNSSVASYEIEVKGENRKEQEPFKRPDVELLSDEGEYNISDNNSVPGRYIVSGKIKNDDDIEQVVNVWVAFYNSNGKILDVNFETIIVQITTEEASDFIVESNTPKADEISDYELYLVFELL